MNTPENSALAAWPNAEVSPVSQPQPHGRTDTSPFWNQPSGSTAVFSVGLWLKNFKS